MKRTALYCWVAVMINAIPSAAAIQVTRSGELVPNAEICYYPAAGADTPFRQQFASNDIRCEPVSEGLQIPPGLWNVYARADHLISAQTTLLDSGTVTPDLEFRLQPAAILDFSSQVLSWPAGTYAAAYLTDTVSLFPLAPKQSELSVPAGRQIVPFLIAGGKPIAIGELLKLEEKAIKPAIAFTTSAKTTDLITWLSIAPEDLKALRSSARPQPPQVTVSSAAGLSQTPVNPVSGTVLIDKALQIIRGVPRERITIELKGSPWKRQAVNISIPSGSPLFIMTEPLRLLPTSTLIMSWFLAADLDDLSKRLRMTCSEQEKPETNAILKAAILNCEGLQDLRLLDRETCEVVAEKDLPSTQSGETRFEDLEPREYVLELRYGTLPAIRRMARLPKFEELRTEVPLEFVTTYGRVTVAGKSPATPVQINFDFGEHRTTTTDDGEYFAILEKPLRRDQTISLRECSGSLDAVHIVDQDVGPNSRYDIDLPANRILITAVDAGSGDPIAGALVRYGAFRAEEMASSYYFRLAYSQDESGRKVLSRTGSDGRLAVESIPPGKIVHVCLEHDEYVRTCPDPFELSSSETKTLRVAMRPNNTFRGKVHSPVPIVAGTLYWFSVDGLQTERVDIKPDGAFGFNREHDLREVVTLVSANLPLFVFSQPFLHRDELMEITIPAAAVRRFEVRLSEELSQKDALVTIAVGGLVVPYPAFSQHLALHGSMLDLRNRGPLLVPDVLQTGPISVLLGPSPGDFASNMKGMDLFRLPQYRGAPRKLLLGDNVVVFDRQSGALSQSIVAQIYDWPVAPPNSA